jgi:Tfp pilus assembly protein PilF
MPRNFALLLAALIVPLAYSTANASSYWVDDVALYDHAHWMAPSNLAARNNYAVGLEKDGQQGEAIKVLEAVLRDYPKNYLANYNLGCLFYEVNLLAAAEHYLQIAQSIDPTIPDLYLEFGRVYLKGGALDQAEANFRHAAEIRPNDSKVHFAYGVVLAQQGDCTSARAQFGEALSLNAKFVKAREQMDKCGTMTPAKEASAASGTAHATAPPSTAPVPLTRPKLASANANVAIRQ